MIFFSRPTQGREMDQLYNLILPPPKCAKFLPRILSKISETKAVRLIMSTLCKIHKNNSNIFNFRLLTEMFFVSGGRQLVEEDLAMAEDALLQHGNSGGGGRTIGTLRGRRCCRWPSSILVWLAVWILHDGEVNQLNSSPERVETYELRTDFLFVSFFRQRQQQQQQ